MSNQHCHQLNRLSTRDLVLSDVGNWYRWTAKCCQKVFWEEEARPIVSGLAQHNITLSYRDAENARHVRIGDAVTAMAYDPAGIFIFISSKKNFLKQNRGEEARVKRN